MSDKFLDFAQSKNLLTKKQVEICENSQDPQSAAVMERFITAEDVAEIYRSLEPESEVYVAKAEKALDSSESIDNQVLELAKQKNLISEASLKVCQLEKQKLEKEGFPVQWAALLYTTGCVDKDTLIALYSEAIGAEVEFVEGSADFADMPLPQIKRVKRKKPKAKPKQKTAVKKAVVKKKTVKKKAVAKKAFAAREEPAEAVFTEDHDDFSDTFEETALDISVFEEDEVVEKIEKVPTPVESVVESPKTQEISGTIGLSQDALEALISAQQEMNIHLKEQMSEILSQSLDTLEDIAGKMLKKSAEGEDGETYEGMPVASAEEVANILESGGTLEGVHIAELKFEGKKFPKKNVVLKSCVIDDIEIVDCTFAGKLEFTGSRFLQKASFRGSCFENDTTFREVRFTNGADFTKTEFKAKANFNTAGFERFVSFNRAAFGKKVIFTRSYFAKGVKFAEVTFPEGASFNDIYVDHRFYMEKCVFGDESTFSGGRFSEVSDFSRCEFEKEVKFKGTNFAKWVSFKSVKFNGDCNMNNMNVSGDLSFDWATFGGLVNFKAMCAERNVSLQSIKVLDTASFAFLDAYLGRLFIASKNISGRLESHIQKDYRTAQKEYGLLKNNFREINEYEKEDWAYLMEKRMERMSIKGITAAPKKFFNWLALDMACGYGTKPINIFVTSLGILVFFALSYIAMAGEFVPSEDYAFNADFPSGRQPYPDKIGLMQSMLISFRTFTNASVGGWVPYVDSWANYLMMFESFLGFFVMTILVVTFSRKVIR